MHVMDASKVRNRAGIMTNENDPCQQEGKMSMKCLEDNDFDKSKCQIYFLNYRNCQKFWKEVRADRSKKNQFPVLPPPEERDKVRLEYQKK